MAQQRGTVQWFYWMAFHTSAGGYGHSYGTMKLVPGTHTEEDIFTWALKEIEKKNPGVSVAVIGYRVSLNELKE